MLYTLGDTRKLLSAQFSTMHDGASRAVVVARVTHVWRDSLYSDAVVVYVLVVVDDDDALDDEFATTSVIRPRSDVGRLRSSHRCSTQKRRVYTEGLASIDQSLRAVPGLETNSRNSRRRVGRELETK